MRSPFGTLFCFVFFALVLGVASAPLLAGNIPIGFVSWDVNIPGSAGQFDITNMTGANSTGDPSFPVTSPEDLTSLALVVDFSDGSTSSFGSSYFTLNSDGISWDGSPIPIGGANPLPVDAKLTGNFVETTPTLFDGTTPTILTPFSATILPSSPPNLSDGDFAIINATTGTATVPEPASVWLLGTCLVAFLGFRHPALRRKVRALYPTASRRTVLSIALLLGLVFILPASSWAQVHLNVATSPSSGVAGVSNVNITGSSFPSGTITPANVMVSWAGPTCADVPATSVPANSVMTILGSVRRINVTIPAGLATGTWFVKVSDSAGGDANFSSTNCSQVSVTHSNPTLSACVPTSSLGIVAPASGPAPVKALVPNGCWSCATTGIQVVQLETGGGAVVAPASVGTPHTVNSCAGNPATGESVCVANNTDVYHLSPTNTFTTLASASNALASFSGGSCNNCGVAINALNNEAVIAMGHTNGLSGTALQTLSLATDVFSPPFDLHNQVSEDISIDPTRGFVLTPNEASVYGIVQVDKTGADLGEFGNAVTPFLEFDSAAEDCTTGIALAVGEFSNTVFLADLTQATFTAGTPGTWTTPAEQQVNIIGAYSAGLSGVTVAPGTSHLATVTGEFGGSSFSVLQLPSTSGSGTPGIVDYAYVQCIVGFSAGLDPHTVSAYTSPNDGKAYTVFASGPPPAELIVADMAGILARPRMADGHTVIGDGGGAGTCLAAGDGVIRSVATH